MKTYHHPNQPRGGPLDTLSNITRSQGHEMTSFYTGRRRRAQFDNLHAAIAAPPAPLI